MKKTGQFDILKIISILMVLVLHYFNKSYGGGLNDSITFNGILTHSLESICIIACNLFVLITSWFMVDTKSIKLKKIFDILIILVFYNIVIYGICVLTGYVKLNSDSLKSFINTITNCWFVIIYLILYILIPFINKGLEKFNKKEVFNLLVIMLIFFSIYPTFLTNVTVKDGGYGIINFITLYIAIYYIKKYLNNKSFKTYLLFLIFIFSTIITTVLSYKSMRLWNYNSIFVITASISLFMLFTKFEIKRNKFITYIASFSLATYIIHSNMFIVRDLYCEIFKSDYYSHTNLLPINLLISIIGIFIGCIIIEIIRRFIFKYSIDKLVSKFKIYNKTIELPK